MTTNNTAPAPTISDLEKKLQYHDWHYSYSDDYSAVRRGERSWDELKGMLKSFSREEVQPLWEKHAPKDYQASFDMLFPPQK